VYYSYQGTEALDGDQPQKSRSAIVNDFKAFIRNHFAHDKRATDDPLLYRCACGVFAMPHTMRNVSLVHTIARSASMGVGSGRGAIAAAARRRRTPPPHTLGGARGRTHTHTRARKNLTTNASYSSQTHAGSS
jgi:hypothetical protein